MIECGTKRNVWPALRGPFAGLALVAIVVGAGGCGGGLRRIGLGTPLAARAPHENGFEKNLRETREAASLAPAEPYWPYHLAELYAGADSLGPAEVAIADALARDATYAPALALRASLDWRAGRYERAIRMLEGTIAKPGAFPNGVPPELTAGLALHYDALGKPDRAQALLAGAPAKKAAPLPALVFLTLKGPSPEAADPLAKAAVLNEPRSAINQNNYGITLLRNGDPIAARQAFEWAAKLDPKLAGPWYNLAILEKYYLFDDSTAALRFAGYWERSHQDPDGLATRFGFSEKKALAQDGD